MDDKKSNIKLALEKFSRKNDNLPKKARKKHNASPEAEVVLSIKNNLEALGWDMTIIEGKANYNVEAGRYLSGAVSPGYPDLSGNTPSGVAVFIEVKNKGKRSTLRPEQREFLIRKINTNCFAMVADSYEIVANTYYKWQSVDTSNMKKNRKLFLLKELPTPSKRDRARDEDLNFD